MQQQNPSTNYYTSNNNPYDDYGLQENAQKSRNQRVNQKLNNSMDQYNQGAAERSSPQLASNSSVRSGSQIKPRNYRNKETHKSVFPMYGLWNNRAVFQSTKQVNDAYSTEILKEAKQKQEGPMLSTLRVDRGHFRKVYFEKTYMEELLKMKNMMMAKKQ